MYIVYVQVHIIIIVNYNNVDMEVATYIWAYATKILENA